MPGLLQESIHPRVYHKEPKVKNTMQAPSKDVARRKIANMEKHLDVHPHDSATRAHMAKVKEIL